MIEWIKKIWYTMEYHLLMRNKENLSFVKILMKLEGIW